MTSGQIRGTLDPGQTEALKVGEDVTASANLMVSFIAAHCAGLRCGLRPASCTPFRMRLRRVPGSLLRRLKISFRSGTGMAGWAQMFSRPGAETAATVSSMKLRLICQGKLGQPPSRPHRACHELRARASLCHPCGNLVPLRLSHLVAAWFAIFGQYLGFVATHLAPSVSG